MNDSATSIPRRKLAQLLYGSSSVFARQPTPVQACPCWRHCGQKRRLLLGGTREEGTHEHSRTPSQWTCEAHVLHACHERSNYDRDVGAHLGAPQAALTPDRAQVSALQRGDVVAHLQRWERPDAAILGVAGMSCKSMVLGFRHKSMYRA